MSNQDTGNEFTGRSNPNGSTESGNGIGKTARDAVSKLSGAAQQVTQQVTQQASQSASDAAATVTHKVKEMLDERVGSGVAMIDQLANSAKHAADELDQNAPQLAGLVRGVAGSIESLSDNLRDKSVDELLRTASDFTRRQPAMVFGLAALAGFFVFRTLKAAPAAASSSAGSASQGARQFHGV